MKRLMLPGSLFGLLWIGLPISGVGQEEIAPVLRYREAAKSLEKLIRAEMTAKDIPGLSIALLDGKEIVWAKGFGEANAVQKTAANAQTIYPIGSVAEALTALLIGQLVREGKLDLDAPISRYLPDFKPENPFDVPIALRHLLAHRSGLVRDPPLGKTLVERLNRTRLVFKPGTRYKHSNADDALAAWVAETVMGKRFEVPVRERIAQPTRMNRSAFQLTEELRKDLALGTDWTCYGKTAPHRTVPPPFGEFYSSVIDLGRLVPALYSTEEKTPALIDPKVLRTLLTPQFSEPENEPSRGLGFVLSKFMGHKQVGSAGSNEGCTTEVSVLPETGLGVVVCINKDAASGIARHLADVALAHSLAVRAGKPLPEIALTLPLKPGTARTLAGRYRSGAESIEIASAGHRAWFVPQRGDTAIELRRLGEGLLGDDALAYGPKILVDGTTLRVGIEPFSRAAIDAPKPLPDRWQGLPGEYGPEFAGVTVLEKDGRLCALVASHFLYPLQEKDEDRFQFPEYGFYAGEIAAFQRGAKRRAEAFVVSGVPLRRRAIDGEDGTTFRIKPLRPIAEVRKEALAAHPPTEAGDFRKPELVDLAAIDKTIRFDIRYATADNFMGTPLYGAARAFLQRPAAEAIGRIHTKLAERGLGLLIFDGYRPWYVTKMFWEATPEAQRIFVADPAQGSRHNRGCAVDLGLYDLKTGKPIEMVSGYDEFSDRSYADYPGGTSVQRDARQRLRRAMEDEGFTIYDAEWWHFDFKDWQKYPILNVRFEDMKYTPRGQE